MLRVDLKSSVSHLVPRHRVQDEFDKKELSIKNLALGKKISENITERSEWKEQRAGQLNIPRDDLINQLKKIFKTE